MKSFPEHGLTQQLNYDVIVNCMHCGLCLPHCPTYALTGNERSSPRGRIRLMKSVVDGVLPLSGVFRDEMEFCLDCQACETACPAGVRYGSLVESARAMIAEQNKEPFIRRMLKKFFLGWVFVRRRRLQSFAGLLRWVDRAGIRRVFRTLKVLEKVFPKLVSLERLAPPISRRSSSSLLPEVYHAKGEKKHRVGFLTGCIMDVSFAEVNVDTVELLRTHGCEVVIPRGQECCGSLHAHNGDLTTARRLAAVNIEAFGNEPLDAIVMNSSGCGAFMKEYGHVFQTSSPMGDAGVRMAAKVKDITEFLIQIGYRPSERPATMLADKIVSYHDACHLVHSQKISREPRDLFRSIPGIDFREIPESSWCCGSAGIYNIVRHDDSMKLLDRKVEHIRSVGPEILVTGNPGCMIQIQRGLEKAGMSLEVMHTSTFLRLACGA